MKLCRDFSFPWGSFRAWWFQMIRLKLIAAVCLTALPGFAGAGERTPPSYQRHVAALFGKLGCSSGTCHGAVKGQNGFQLSLFGADPTGDHARLIRDFGSRRLNFFDPDRSLLLLKGTGQIPHGGGARLRAGSAEYQILRNWIAAGAAADDPAKSQLKGLRVLPAERIAKPDEKYRLKVEAEFSDGTTEDVTAFCSFESLDRAVANEGWKIVGLTRLSPVFPFTLLNYAFGITRVKLGHYVIASWIGMVCSVTPSSCASTSAAIFVSPPECLLGM